MNVKISVTGGTQENDFPGAVLPGCRANIPRQLLLAREAAQPGEGTEAAALRFSA